MTYSGDCEDYAIAKFFALRELGFANQELRIAVVYDNLRRIGHAVLAVYVEGDILIGDVPISVEIRGAGVAWLMMLCCCRGPGSYDSKFVHASAPDCQNAVAMPRLTSLSGAQVAFFSDPLGLRRHESRKRRRLAAWTVRRWRSGRFSFNEEGPEGLKRPRVGAGRPRRLKAMSRWMPQNLSLVGESSRPAVIRSARPDGVPFAGGGSIGKAPW